MKYIYLAGPIFTAADQQWMSHLKKTLQDDLSSVEKKVVVIWPFENTPKNHNRVNTIEAMNAVLNICVESLNRSDMVIAVLDGSQVDDGTAWEIGYFHSHTHGKGKVLGLRTDFRNGGDVPGGKVNSLIEANCVSISTTVSQLVKKAAKELL